MIPADVALLRTPGSPALSPDGTTVVFPVTSPDPDTDEYTGQLWSVPTDGSTAPARLTRGHRDTAPAFSPDGRWIAFVRAEPTGKPQLHVVEATGGEPVRLTDAPLGVSEPRFSPDGTRLAYLARVPEADRYVPGGDPGAEPPRHITTYRYRGDGVGFFRDRPQQLFLVDVPTDPHPGDLPEPVVLTAGDTDIGAHRWLPDGDHLVAVTAVHPGREEDLLRDAVVVDARPGPDGPVAPRALTGAAGASTLAIDTVLPSADGGTLWMLASDQGPTRLEFVASQTGLFSLDLTAALAAAAALAATDDDGTSTSTSTRPLPHRRTDVDAVDLVPGLLAVAGDEVLVADQRRGAVVLVALPADVAADVAPADAPTGRVLVDSPAVVQGVAAAPDGSRVVVTAAAPDSAGDVLAVDASSGATTPLTDLSADLRATGRLQTPRELTATPPTATPSTGGSRSPTPSGTAAARTR